MQIEHHIPITLMKTEQPKFHDAPSDYQTESKTAYINHLQILEQVIFREQDDKDSIPGQLANPIRRAQIGVVIPSKEAEPDSHHTLILKSLLGTFESFADPESQTFFLEWLTSEIQGQNRDQALALFKSLADTALMLDVPSYIQFTCTSNNRFSTLPLQTLALGMSLVREQGEVSSELESTMRLFDAQYDHLMDGAEDIFTDPEQIDQDIRPDAIELGNALLEWVQKNGTSAPDKDLQRVLTYLEIYNAHNIEAFIESQNESPGYLDLRRRAIEYHLATPKGTEIEDVLRKGLLETLNKKLIDAAERNYNELGEDSSICFAFETGAFGPFHRAHLHTAEMMEELFSEGEREDHKFRGIFCMIPAGSPTRHGSRTAKSPIHVGPLEDRVECIHISTRQLPRITISTQFEDPTATSGKARVDSIRDNIYHTLSKGKKGKVGIVRVFGTDKIFDPQKDLKEEVGEYGDEPAFVKTRRGDLARTLKLLEQIRELYPEVTLLLTPDIPKASSSEAIIRKDPTYFSRVAQDPGDWYWANDRLNQLQNGGERNEQIESATVYGERIQEKIQKRLKKLTPA